MVGGRRSPYRNEKEKEKEKEGKFARTAKLHHERFGEWRFLDENRCWSCRNPRADWFCWMADGDHHRGEVRCDTCHIRGFRCDWEKGDGGMKKRKRGETAPPDNNSTIFPTRVNQANEVWSEEKILEDIKKNPANFPKLAPKPPPKPSAETNNTLGRLIVDAVRLLTQEQRQTNAILTRIAGSFEHVSKSLEAWVAYEKGIDGEEESGSSDDD